VAWNIFWIAMGVAGAAIAVLLFLVMPPGRKAGNRNWAGAAATAIWAVGSNPQSILCGLIAGLFFIPTTIFDMTWGVRFLQEGHDMPYGMAVLRSASVPFGWIIGCPLAGLLSDRMGQRKPVIVGSGLLLAACLATILYAPADLFPPFLLGLLTGIASGAAMLPYTVIKEANRPEHSGTATGVVNFINFSFSALLGPVFGGLLLKASGGGVRELEHYRTAFSPLLYGVVLAVLLTLLLKETGPRARSASPPVIPSHA
jgi:predicted MFS family arabinose efflux permease